MAWTHKNRKEIKVMLNISGEGAEAKQMFPEEIKANKTLKTLLMEMQKDCIQLALQNNQANKGDRDKNQ